MSFGLFNFVLFKTRIGDLLSSNGSRANAKTKSMLRGRERFVSLLYRSSGLAGLFFSSSLLPLVVSQVSKLLTVVALAPILLPWKCRSAGRVSLNSLHGGVHCTEATPLFAVATPVASL